MGKISIYHFLTRNVWFHFFDPWGVKMHQAAVSDLRQKKQIKKSQTLHVTHMPEAAM